MAALVWPPLELLLQLVDWYCAVNSNCAHPHYFIVNLTEIYSTALLESEYQHLPTLGMSWQLLFVHVIQSFLLCSFRRIPINGGYSGTFSDEPAHGRWSILPWLLWGASVPVSKGFPVGWVLPMMWLQVCLLRFILHVNYDIISFLDVAMAIASSSHIPNHEAAIIHRCTALNNASAALAANIPAPLPTSWAITQCAAHPNSFKAGILYRLQRGRGLTESEHQSLFERCGFCGQYFLTSLLCHHIIICGARV